MTSSPFRHFAEAADAARLAAGTKARIGILATYLRPLPAGDLPHAATWLTGTPFAASSGETLGAGWAAVREALRVLLPALTDEDLQQALLATPDAGFAAGVLLHGQPSAGLSIQAVADVFRHMSRARGKARVPLLADLLAGMDALEATYAVKLVTGELRIGSIDGLVEAAIAEASGLPLESVRRALQASGDPGEVAHAARAGNLDAIQPRAGRPLRPMLASPAAGLDEVASRLGTGLWVEDKFDGIRAQLHTTGAGTVLFSRDLRNISRQFPELGASPSLPEATILDGEIVAWQDGRALPFRDLQGRLGRRQPDGMATPVAYVAYDILIVGGTSLLDRPLRDRRAVLEALHLDPPLLLAPVQRIPWASLDREFGAARERGNEGLMVKDPDSPYVPGRRGSHWLKIKRSQDPLDVVVVRVERGHGKRRHLYSDYTFAVRDEASGGLVNLGKAYSGLTDAELTAMSRHFETITVRDGGWYRDVRPEVVIEVAFDVIQASPRHGSGYALRFPRIVRLRPDRTAADIATLADVRARAGASIP